MRIRDEELIPLASERCRPARGIIAPLSAGESERLLRRLPGGWRIDNKGQLIKEYFLRDFAEALDFVNHIGALADREKHHPELHLAWGLVRVRLWTAKLGGLQRSDFVLAAKIEDLARFKNPAATRKG
ncbi:MAG TPA: 4a-hydroxytetrahydrobiopterin dehydratase [Sedimentisphaerales bacterium]|nr:4a-hydroxytetrahydrobiopterin dehydratase [Sedimentisphaerales bacterium]